MDDQLEYGFSAAVFVLDHTAGKVTPQQADSAFSEVTKENFWRMWPVIRDWSQALWQRLEDERAIPAKPVEDELFDDVGGGG